MGWQPIETAPKDGRSILLWGDWIGEINGRLEESPCVAVGFRMGGAWYASVSDAYVVECNATHWQPLPEPPK